MKKTFFLSVFAFFCLTFPAWNQSESKSIVLATTTSTQATGLLDELLPAFAKANGITVKPVAVGTGRALELARNGDADLVMVHARKLEDKFVSEGFGVNAWDLMYNDFLIAGPAEDPAKIQGSQNINMVMKKVAESGEKFISRADKSGTHERELELWNNAKTKMSGKTYVEAGQGMAEILTIAGEMKAYVLCDRATWLSMRKKLPIQVLYENPEELKNSYGVIAVSNAKVKTAKTELANAFIDWVVEKESQKIIGSFSVDGEALFHLSIKKR